MDNKDWDKAEIRRLTAESGRPLEVRCATEFITAGWDVRLGTYFEDVFKVRELDMLVEKGQTLEVNGGRMDVRVRILGSAKGFTRSQSPVTYSVSSHNPGLFGATLVSGHRDGNKSYGSLNELARREAAYLLEVAGLTESRVVFGLDIFTRDGKKAEPAITYRRNTDRDLYEGLDSSIKATAFWTQRDIRQGNSYATLNVPLLVTSMPFWDVSIDDGQVGESELRSDAHIIGLCPYRGVSEPPVAVISMLWAVNRLDALIHALDLLFVNFSNDVLIEAANW